jgi:heptosyltransferase-2
MVEYYLRLAAQIAPGPAAVPESIPLRLSPGAIDRARRLLADSGVAGPYVVICPVAIGTHRGKVKAWDGFGRLASELAQAGHRVVAMPGPGETAPVRAALPGATILPERDVATFAAVLADARLVLANDSGAGHLAAAVGVPLISVFGVTELEKTRPWGPRAQIVGASTSWPRYDDVLGAAVNLLGA